MDVSERVARDGVRAHPGRRLATGRDRRTAVAPAHARHCRARARLTRQAWALRPAGRLDGAMLRQLAARDAQPQRRAADRGVTGVHPARHHPCLYDHGAGAGNRFRVARPSVPATHRRLHEDG